MLIINKLPNIWKKPNRNCWKNVDCQAFKNIFEQYVDFNIRRHVCVDSELEWLDSLPTKQANLALRIIFSAKESIFKCLYPSTKTYLTFKDAAVTVNKTENSFSFTIFKSCPGIIQQGFRHHGQYSEMDKMLLTSVYI